MQILPPRAAAGHGRLRTERSRISRTSSRVRRTGLPAIELATSAASAAASVVARGPGRARPAVGPRAASTVSRIQATASADLGVRVAGEQPRGLRVPAQRRVAGLALGQRTHVDLGGRREHRRADPAVRGARHPAQRRRQAVHRAELGVRQGHAGQQAGQAHVRAGGEVRAVGERPAQAGGGPGQPLAGQRVADRVGLERGERFQALGQRVESRPPRSRPAGRSR